MSYKYNKYQTRTIAAKAVKMSEKNLEEKWVYLK